MSLLFPIYFAGALAIGLPILFHLIRRQPKGNVVFSSLMFLRPTPPRLTRRSRLDNWPLLLCRALALLLLAAAFTRPFLRSAGSTEFGDQGQRIVIAIDTSASMQRNGVWEEAINAANEIVADLSPADQVVIVTFDQQPKVHFSLEQSLASSPSERVAAIDSILKTLAPTWQATDLGTAISFCAELVTTYEADSTTGADAPASVILISDMQTGSGIEKLQSFAWPETLRLQVQQVSGQTTTNAWAQILTSTITNEDDDQASTRDQDNVRVRVSNSAVSKVSRFELAWIDAAQNATQSQTVQVLPGQTQIIRMPMPESTSVSLRLSGDEIEFDNERYYVAPVQKSLELWLIENEATTIDPRDSLAYYIDRVPLSNHRRTVTVSSVDPASMPEIDVNTTPLVVVTEPRPDEFTQRLEKYAEAGGTVLYAVTDDTPEWQATISAALATPEIQISEAVVKNYAMLSSINFQHPLFAKMAEPQFNDFTKVRFWSHRVIEGVSDEIKVLASFDDETPAMMQRTIGDGRIIVMAAGWQPNESQLALSTKFIPMIFNLFEMSETSAGETSHFLVGEQIASDAANQVFDKPEVYQRELDGNTESFALNLAEAESHLEPIDTSLLERFGINLADSIPADVKLAEQRQMRDVELESNQKLWQWLLVAALAMLGCETLLVRKYV
jgi:hypothetical protein